MVSGAFHRLHIEIIKDLDRIKGEIETLKDEVDNLYDLAEKENETK